MIMMMMTTMTMTKLAMTVTTKCCRKEIVAITTKVYNSSIDTRIAIQSLRFGPNSESLRLPALHALHTSPLRNFSLASFQMLQLRGDGVSSPPVS
jgi:transcriptional regulator of met regulon